VKLIADIQTFPCP